MRTLNFTITKQKLTKDNDCNFDNLVTGTENYLEAFFKFDDDWIMLRNICVFKGLDNLYRSPSIEKSVMIRQSGKCQIPKQILEYPIVQLYVVGINQNKKIYTNDVHFRQERVV